MDTKKLVAFFQTLMGKNKIYSDTDTLLESTRSSSVSLPDPTILSLKVSRETEWNPDQAIHLTQALVSSLSIAAFQIEATEEGIAWKIIDPNGLELPEILKRTVQAVYSPISVEIAKWIPAYPFPFFRCEVYYQHARPFVRLFNLQLNSTTGHNDLTPLKLSLKQ